MKPEVIKAHIKPSNHKSIGLYFTKFSITLFNYWVGLSFFRDVKGLGKVIDIGFVKVVLST